MHEMWDVLDAFGNSIKLRENRKINSSNNNKKGILKFGRKNAVQTPQECEYLCTKPLTDAFLKGNPFRQCEAAISLKDIKAAVARTQRITELSVKRRTFVMLYLLFFKFTVYFDTKFPATEGNWDCKQNLTIHWSAKSILFSCRYSVFP